MKLLRNQFLRKIQNRLNSISLSPKKSVQSENAKNEDALNENAMTLTELLIVIAVIAMIGTYVGTQVFGKFDQAKVDSTKIQIRNLTTILDDFRRVCSTYPTTDMGLQALVEKPATLNCPNYYPEGFIGGNSKKVPKDAWDTDFIYESDGATYKITSLGSDRAAGGDGRGKDISSDALE